MSESEETREDRYADVDTSHLADVEDGCGCTEIWEHTSGGAERNEAPEDASGEAVSAPEEADADVADEADEDGTATAAE